MPVYNQQDQEILTKARHISYRLKKARSQRKKIELTREELGTLGHARSIREQNSGGLGLTIMKKINGVPTGEWITTLSNSGKDLADFLARNEARGNSEHSDKVKAKKKFNRRKRRNSGRDKGQEEILAYQQGESE